VASCLRQDVGRWVQTGRIVHPYWKLKAARSKTRMVIASSCSKQSGAMSKDLSPWRSYRLIACFLLQAFNPPSRTSPACGPSALHVKRGDTISRIVTMQPSKIFETVLYAEDLAAAERFYHEALGLEVISVVI